MDEHVHCIVHLVRVLENVGEVLVIDPFILLPQRTCIHLCEIGAGTLEGRSLIGGR